MNKRSVECGPYDVAFSPLPLSQSELRNYSWSEVVERLKEAQQQHRMAIQKKHINELGQSL